VKYNATVTASVQLLQTASVSSMPLAVVAFWFFALVNMNHVCGVKLAMGSAIWLNQRHIKGRAGHS